MSLRQTTSDHDQERRRIGPYVLVDQVGRGGMGEVFRAEHVATGAVHALKVVTPHTPDDALRFLREAEAMARVEGHPHVLRVHASGQDGARLWLAIEWAPGGNLADRLARGPLALDDLAPLGRALALGLAHVHARGVLHRDLKPANVLFDADGAAKLADFGVARLHGARALTQTGAIVGTPAYMAPEQALGAGNVDERVDVYGLGAILYHAATGRPPFDDAGSPMATLAAVIETLPADPRSLRPDLPVWLARELRRALSKSPDDRHASAQAFAAALLEPVERRRNAAPLVGGAVAVLVVAIALALGLAATPAPAPMSTEPSRIHHTTSTGPTAEALLASGEPLKALEAAQREPGEEARWVQVRALLLLDRASETTTIALSRDRREVTTALQRLDALRHELRKLEDVFMAFRATAEGVVTEGRKHPDGMAFGTPYLPFAKLLEEIRTVAPPPAHLCKQAGPAGVAVVERLMDALAAQFPELLRLVRNEGDALLGGRLEEVLEALGRLVAAAPGSRSGRTLDTVAVWLRFVCSAPARRAAADRDALVRAAKDELLEPRYRRLAELAALEADLGGATSLSVLTTLDARLGAPPPDRLDPLMEPYRRAAENLGDRYLKLAWSDRAQRRVVLAQLDRLLVRVPQAEFHDTLAKLWVISALLSGREPTDAELGAVRPTTVHGMILQGEVLLGRGQWSPAAERFREAQLKINESTPLCDARIGLALALTLGGDPDAGAAALAEASERSTSWLPWRTLADGKLAVAKARAGAWAPSPGRPFPPD